MTMPLPGSNEWDSMIDFMRKDLESGMAYTKIEMAARKILDDEGRDFNIEFEKWKEENNIK